MYNEGKYINSLIRISTIKEIKDVPRSKGEGEISEEEKEKIEYRIKKYGLMYYFADPVKCRIHLTDEGLRMYHTIIHQRPGYYNLIPETDGSGYIMELECCELNIIHYFFRFGKQVTILEPESTRKRFIQMYREPLDNYRDI